jgi:hypothetical protein
VSEENVIGFARQVGADHGMLVTPKVELELPSEI